MPSDGGAARSHVANVIDQTSRVFQDGDTRISRGSAVKYTDKFTGEESGVEYARVWTKDRPFMTNFDTMPLATNQKDINTKKYKQTTDEYYITYRFTEQQTSEIGRFEGKVNIQFKNSDGDNTTKLILPIKERLYINIF